MTQDETQEDLLLPLSLALAQAGPLLVKIFPNGDVAEVYLLTYMRARLSIGPPGSIFYRDEW